MLLIVAIEKYQAVEKSGDIMHFIVSSVYRKGHLIRSKLPLKILRRKFLSHNNLGTAFSIRLQNA
jgi:hypothetical protein